VTLLPPCDNALFMRFWRPAVRPGRLIPFAVLLVLALAVVLFACYMSRPVHPGRGPAWFVVAFGITVAIQAVVLLLLGSFFVGSAAYQEAATGAMDFHRASATTPLNQALGLVAGPATLAWLLFAVGIPFTLGLAMLGAVTAGAYLAVLLSLALTGVFFHTVSALIGLTARKGRLGLGQQAGSLGAAFFLVCVSVPFAHSDWSLPGYLTGYPVIGRALGGAEEIRSAIGGVELPPLVIQALVQCPLLVLLGAALRRAVAYPNRPPVSKTLGLLLSLALFALFVASYCTGSVIPRDLPPGKVRTSVGDVASWSLLFAFVLGVAMVYLVTPRYVLYCNGLRRRRKLGLRWPGPFDDALGNTGWVVTFGVLSAAFYYSLSDGNAWLPVEALLAMLLYLGWFAGAVEHFRLTPERRRGAVFVVTIATLWALIPAFGFVAMASQRGWPLYGIALVSPCPIFGIIAPDLARTKGQVGLPQPATTCLILGVNFVLLAIFAWLARAARHRAAAKAHEPGAGAE